MQQKLGRSGVAYVALHMQWQDPLPLAGAVTHQPACMCKAGITHLDTVSHRSNCQSTVCTWDVDNIGLDSYTVEGGQV
jgi:hypothetical protein